MSDAAEVEEIERSLRLRDHIDYQEVLRHQLIKVQTAFETNDLQRIMASLSALQSQTPTAWYDKKWEEDLQSSQYMIEVDTRPLCCGVRLNMAYCLANGIPTSRQVVFVDPARRLQAIINLWDRKGYTSRRQIWEESTGIPFQQYVKSLQQKHLLEEGPEEEMPGPGPDTEGS